MSSLASCSSYKLEQNQGQTKFTLKGAKGKQWHKYFEKHDIYIVV